jgi:hypothetical protein
MPHGRALPWPVQPPRRGEHGFTACEAAAILPPQQNEPFWRTCTGPEFQLEEGLVESLRSRHRAEVCLRHKSATQRRFTPVSQTPVVRAVLRHPKHLRAEPTPTPAAGLRPHGSDDSQGNSGGDELSSERDTALPTSLASQSPAQPAIPVGPPAKCAPTPCSALCSCAPATRGAASKTSVASAPE